MTGKAKADVLVLGNVITLDDVKPQAQAVVVKDGIIIYVGSKKTALTLCDENTSVLDYGENTVYPGFIESHTHASFVGYRAIGQADLNGLPADGTEEYRPIIEKFIADNPGKEMYLAAGWGEGDGEELTHEFLDSITEDVPLLMNTSGGHSLLMNTAAMKHWGIDAAKAVEKGTDLIHVYENGEPTGYVCEEIAIGIFGEASRKVTIDEAKSFILNWQDFAFSKGFTGAADAGSNLFMPVDVPALGALDKEGALKLRIYSYINVPDNPDDPTGVIEDIIATREELGGEYFVVVGAKCFLDGVMEAHTSWMMNEYLDAPGYYGSKRFDNADKMIELISAAAKYNMPIHVHSEGSGATHFMLDCIELSQAETGNMNQRNALAHLHFVDPEDIQRMSDTNSVAIVPPTWAPAIPGMVDAEIAYVGKELSDKSYPVKSFFDAGANTVYHSDYPVGGVLSIQENFFSAETRAMPATDFYMGQLPGATEEDFAATARGMEEAVSREQSLRAQTINVARMVHQEDKVGSLEPGKIANMTVFNTNFLTCDVNKIMDAEVVATIVDGEVVYSA